MFTATALCKSSLLHRQLVPWLVAAGVFLTGSFSIASAEIVTDRFVCELGAERRSIELTFLNEVNSLPCEIRETREDGQTRILWRASFDVSFCQRQIDSHRRKLDALGWPCESTPVNENNSARSTTGNNPDRSNPDSLSSRALRSLRARRAGDDAGRVPAANRTQNTTDPVVAVVSLQVADSDLPAGNTASPSAATPAALSTVSTTVAPPLPSRVPPTMPAVAAARDREVQFMENRNAAELRPSDRPAPPDFLTDPLSPESLQQFDDWLIYLSAQSMASIRQVIGDQETFNDYLVAENLKSDNIYTRLQNRIEFLQSLLEEQ